MHLLVWKCTNLFKISLKFVPKVQINNIPSLVQIMAWCQLANKPLSDIMMVSLLRHICVGLNELTLSMSEKISYAINNDSERQIIHTHTHIYIWYALSGQVPSFQVSIRKVVTSTTDRFLAAKNKLLTGPRLNEDGLFKMGLIMRM